MRQLDIVKKITEILRSERIGNMDRSEAQAVAIVEWIRSDYSPIMAKAVEEVERMDVEKYSEVIGYMIDARSLLIKSRDILAGLPTSETQADYKAVFACIGILSDIPAYMEFRNKMILLDQITNDLMKMVY